MDGLDETKESRIRDRAIELAVKYFENKDLVPVVTFQTYFERIYDFLKNGKTESRV